MSIKRAVSVIQKLYPVAYSETAWDNTGLLVDCSSNVRDKPLKVLLTIDLTKKVVDEAIKKDIELIVAYHPFLFKKFNKIEPSIPQHESLIRLIQNGISVYSPHTSVDSVRHGVNDWLLEGLKEKGEVSVICPNATNPDVGVGRIIRLEQTLTIKQIIDRLKFHLGVKDLLLGTTQSLDTPMRTIAVCAGSGGSVFEKAVADCYVTGELSHHEGLSLKEKGCTVILANHSNTERGYLIKMKQLMTELDGEIYISEADEDTYRFI